MLVAFVSEFVVRLNAIFYECRKLNAGKSLLSSFEGKTSIWKSVDDEARI